MSTNAIGQKALAAQDLLSRALTSRAYEDVEAAVGAWHHLSQITDTHYPYREAILSTFTVALLLRWECYRDVSDLDLAIENAERALRLTHNAPNRDRYQNLANLGSAYLDRAEAAVSGPERALEDAKLAYSYLEKALWCYMQRGKDLHLRWEVMVCLARVHKWLYENRANGSQSLERIVHLMNEAIPLVPHGEEGPALFLLGDAHRFLYIRRDDSRFLREALSRLQSALERPFKLSTDRLDALIALGVCYFEAYNRYRKMEDLDLALETFKRASVESQQSSTYANVANVLYHKYKETADLKLLDEAIEYYGVELAMTEDPETRRGIGRRYYAYGKALAARHSIKRDISDIEKAVEFLEKAVRRASRDDLREFATILEKAKQKLEQAREEIRRDEARAQQVQTPTPTTPLTPTSPTAVSTGSTTRTQTPVVGVDTISGPMDITTPKPRPRVLKKTSGLSTISLKSSKSSKVPTLGTLPQKQPIDMSALNRALNVIGVHSRWSRQR